MSTSREFKEKPLCKLTDPIRADWQRLAESVHANYSLFPAWTEITARSHGIAEQSCVLMTYEDQRMTSAFPVTVSGRSFLGIPFRSLELIGNWVSYHNCPVSSLDPEATLDLLIEAACRHKADVLHLATISDDSDIGALLKTKDHQTKFSLHSLPGEASPYLPLHTTWDDLLASKPKKFRYKVRKRAELLEASNDLTMQWFGRPLECAELLEAMRNVEDRSWKKEAGISIFERDYERRYHELLLQLLSAENALLANVLYQANTPIAYNLCCVKNGWVGQLKTSFDTRFAELSPGSLVIDYAIRHAIELGAAEFDFLGDTDPHKLAWTKSVRSHTDYYLYLNSSLKGRAIGKLKEFRQHFSRPVRLN